MTLRNLVLRPVKNDRGIALPMVLLIFFLSIALVSAFLVAIVGSSNVTAANKSMVQAQAAAEAGIAAAHAELLAGDPCEAISGELIGANPTYLVTAECDGDETQIAVISTGEAEDGSTAKVEAVFAVLSTEHQPIEGGPGLFYTYGMSTRVNNYVFDEVHSEVTIEDFSGSAGVYASNGNIDCGWGSVFPSDVYTKTGDLKLDGGCVVEGDAYIGGRANLNGGSVNGQLVAPKNVGHNLGNGSTVGTAERAADVKLGGNFTLNGATVFGSVTSSASGQNTIHSGSIEGNLTHGGTIGGGGTLSSIVKGEIAKRAGLVAPELPTIPNWQDVSFVPIDASTPPPAWVDAGYELTTVSGAGACALWSGNATNVSSLASTLTANMIYDIRSCSGGFSTNAGGANKTVSVNRDIAIIANHWDLSGTHFVSADGGDHTIFLITPDGAPTTPGPQCNSPAKGSEQKNLSTVAPEIAIYLYTPCNMKFNGGQFRGQVYAGSLEFGGGVTIAFAPRHIPGYDFSEGLEDESGSGGGSTELSQLGDLLSQRNVK